MSNETNWIQIKKEYLRRTVDGEKVVLTDLAKKHGVKPTTLRSRKNREKWDDFLENVADTINKQRNAVATQKQSGDDTKGRKGKWKGTGSQDKTAKELISARISIGMLGNSNAVGNTNAPPKGNQRARKHGFYSKHLPPGTMDLFDDIEGMDQLELLWDSIKLKYAAIIRAQSIMYVEDQDDTTEHLKKHKIIKGLSFTEEKEYEVQFAWDKYATFLQAQSRAMGELRSLIKSYNEIVDRGMATKEQQLRVQKLQAEIEKISGDDAGEEVKSWVSAIEEIAAKRSDKKDE